LREVVKDLRDTIFMVPRRLREERVLHPPTKI
jgi:hypothetical protein